MRQQRYTTENVQGGLSIIELMIALALGSVLTLGLVQIFSSNSQSFRLNDSSARVQESGRIAADILSRALRNAGFFGCFPINPIVNNLDDTDGDYDNALHNFRVEGISAESALRPAGAVAGTDFFLVSGLRHAGTNISTTAQVNSASFQVTSAGNLQAGSIVMINDCANGDIFEVSLIQETGGGAQITLVANGNDGQPGNDFSANSPAGCSDPDSCLSAIYGVGAQVLQAYNELYFIGTGASGDNALFLRNSAGATVELVSGVTDMDVRFGTGTVESGVQNWVDADSVSDWASVIAVEVSLMFESARDNLALQPQQLCFPGWLECDGDAVPYMTASDRRLYRVYTFTTALRNRI